MNFKECYICFDSIPEVFFRSPCIDDKHQICNICYCKAGTPKNCPMCRQGNPNYIETQEDQQDDYQFEDEIFETLVAINEQLNNVGQLVIDRYNQYVSFINTYDSTLIYYVDFIIASQEQNRNDSRIGESALGDQ